MSRRKQAKPIRHLDDEEGPSSSTLLMNGQSSSGEEPGSFNSVGEGVGSSSEHSSGGEEGSGGSDNPDSSEGGNSSPPANLFLKRTVDEDFANNNNRDGDDEEEEMDAKSEDKSIPPLGNISDQLKSISSTISHLTANAASNTNPKTMQELAVLQATLFSLQQQQLLQMQILTQMQQQLQISNKDKDSPIPSIAELAEKHGVQNSLLDGLLMSSGVKAKEDRVPPSIPTAASSIEENEYRSSHVAHVSTSPSSTPLPPSLPPHSKSFNNVLEGPDNNNSTSLSDNKPASLVKHSTASRVGSQIIDPNAPSSLASSIIMHHDSPGDEKPVNSLELLQKRAQGILNNASQGLLANNLADFGCGKDKDSFDKKGEPFFKHRCRYCGKVFGSDSALQIHVRSHTGERPYKCNVCGNRFTTKGNLKVHFQRHSGKFPLVKMNPNLVPEHLDKFYPPLLQQIEEAEKKGQLPPPMNDPMAGMRPVIPPGMRMPNLPGMPGPPPLPNPSVASALPKFPSLPTNSSSRSPLSGLFAPFSLPTEPLRKEDMPQNLSFPPPSMLSPTTLLPEKSPLLLPTPEKSNLTEEDQEVKDVTSKISDEENEEVAIEELSNDGDAPNSDKKELEVDDNEEEDVEVTEDGGETPTIIEREEVEEQEEPENLSKSRASIESPASNTSIIEGDDDERDEEIMRNDQNDEDIIDDVDEEGRTSIPLSSSDDNPPRRRARASGFDPAKDPNVYTNLLPRPGSNDNAWESLIEVARPSDTAKLEALVNNIENKLTDPNECAICHRVLSCKSALQMHYRTHTGERPFKCRICGRAFTTKGNLKTHMGVHRAKPPMRMFHQCPVCHKKYANALVLQQHIKTHTGEPTELSSEQIAAAEIRDFPQLPFSPGGGLSMAHLRLPGSSSALFPGLPSSFSLPEYGSASPDDFDDDNNSLSDEKMDESGVERPSRPSSVSSSSSSNTVNPMASVQSTAVTSSSVSLLNSFTTDTLTKLSDHRPFGLVRPFFMDRPHLPEDLSPIRKPSEEKRGDSPVSPPKNSPSRPQETNSPLEDRLTPNKSNKTSRTSSPKISSALDLTPQTSQSNLLLPGFPGLIGSGAGFPGSLLSGSGAPLSQLGATFNPLRLPFPVVPGIKPRGNTTCQICFKVFACNSALEIHIRSHTKERPFKCEYCDRGFSTKGNMKQHALTHKTRDGNCSSSSDGTGSNNSSKDYSNSQPLSSNLRKKSEEGPSTIGIKPFAKEGSVSPALLGDHALSGFKRSPPESESLPSAKRSYGGTVEDGEKSYENHSSVDSQKHLCHVCKKNFSSCSALQIHMRTHTGDRPFKCNVCGKAFTTKGNLKVHMGIHMWSNTQASRRGRRMSLDLPRPPIPMTAKDSEFLQRRPELFYPYLQTPFNNNGGGGGGGDLVPLRPNVTLSDSIAASASSTFPSVINGTPSGGGTPLPATIRFKNAEDTPRSSSSPPKKDWPWSESSKDEPPNRTGFHESILA